MASKNTLIIKTQTFNYVVYRFDILQFEQSDVGVGKFRNCTNAWKLVVVREHDWFGGYYP